MICKSGDVGRELIEIIGLESSGLFAQIIAALIGRDEWKPASPRECRDRIDKVQRHPVGFHAREANRTHFRWRRLTDVLRLTAYAASRVSR
jgi:hypothetical protein